jgi:hypothetical protein
LFHGSSCMRASMNLSQTDFPGEVISPAPDEWPCPSHGRRMRAYST